MRYLTNFDISELNIKKTDVLIVGSGISGLYTSLSIKENLEVMIISKDEMTLNNSYLVTFKAI